VKADYQANVQTLSIKARPEQLARYGIDAQDLLAAVTAAGGQEVGHVFEGRARFPIIVRFPLSWREDAERLAQLPVHVHGEQLVPLGELAEIVLDETPPGIEHEAGQRRTFVQANVRGRDVASFVQEAQRVVNHQAAHRLSAPVGRRFENLVATCGWRHYAADSADHLLCSHEPPLRLPRRRRSSWRYQWPLRAFFWLRDMPFSISAGVGFIALFGVAVLNGLVWVSGAENLRATGVSPGDAARETAENRLRPVLVTALVAGLGFLPMATSATAGAEIQRPLATVVIGGLLTSTLLTALVIPAISRGSCPRQIPVEDVDCRRQRRTYSRRMWKPPSTLIRSPVLKGS
jgi:cobalt-zinc-cadmium resistance protein CzcA